MALYDGILYNYKNNKQPSVPTFRVYKVHALKKLNEAPARYNAKVSWCRIESANSLLNHFQLVLMSALR